MLSECKTRPEKVKKLQRYLVVVLQHLSDYSYLWMIILDGYYSVTKGYT